MTKAKPIDHKTLEWWINSRLTKSRVWQNTFMTGEDADTFTAMLRPLMPKMRIVSDDYWQHYVDWPAWDAAVAEHDRQERLGAVPRHLPHPMRNPAGSMPPQLSSLSADPSVRKPKEILRSITFWNEPAGWTPEWNGPDEFGVYKIANFPSPKFKFTQCSHFRLDCSKWPFNQYYVPADYRPEDEDEIVVMHTLGGFSAHWDRYDKASETLVRKVFNVVSRMTIDRFIEIDYGTRRPFRSALGGIGRDFACAAAGAATWAMRRRHNYFWAMPSFLKPPGYPYKPGDAYTEAELAEYYRRCQEEFDEISRQIDSKTIRSSHSQQD